MKSMEITTKEQLLDALVEAASFNKHILRPTDFSTADFIKRWTEKSGVHIGKSRATQIIKEQGYVSVTVGRRKVWRRVE